MTVMLSAAAVDDRAHRVHGHHAGAGRVEREVGAGHVGDRDVEDRAVAVGHLMREYSRAARAATAGAANSVQSVSVVGADGLLLLLGVPWCPSEMACEALDRVVDRRWPATTSIADTWLPIVPFWSSVRTEIGTMATSRLVGQLVAVPSR